MSEKPKGTLSKILEEAGIKDFTEMNDLEKKTFEQYQQILSSPDITINDLKKIIPAQIQHLQNQVNDYDISPLKAIYLKARIKNMQFLEKMIVGPAKEKKRLVHELKNKFNI